MTATVSPKLKRFLILVEAATLFWLHDVAHKDFVEFISCSLQNSRYFIPDHLTVIYSFLFISRIAHKYCKIAKWSCYPWVETCVSYSK